MDNDRSYDDWREREAQRATAEEYTRQAAWQAQQQADAAARAAAEAAARTQSLNSMGQYGS